MRVCQAIKLRKTGKVIGYFYKKTDGGKVLYISFRSSVESVREVDIVRATPVELEATKELQRKRGSRGRACAISLSATQ